MTADHDTRQHQIRAASKPPDGAAPIPIRSDELLRGRNEVLIDHAGCLYRLRLTRAGKLILHK